MNTHRQRIKYVLSDWIATTLGWGMFNTYRYDLVGYLSHRSLADYMASDNVLLSMLICPLLWLVVFTLSGYYLQPLFKSYLGELRTTTISILVGILLFFFASYIDDIPFIDQGKIKLLQLYHLSPRLYLGILFAMFTYIFIPTYLGRYFITYRAKHKIKTGQWGYRTLLVGNGKEAQQILKDLRKSETASGYKITGCINSGFETVERVVEPATWGDAKSLDSQVRNHCIEAFLLAPDVHSDRGIYEWIYRVMPYKLPILLRSGNPELLIGLAANQSKSFPIIDIRLKKSAYTILAKRTVDVLASLIVLLVTSPWLLYIHIWRRDLELHEEVIGIDRKPFMAHHLALDSRAADIPLFWNVLKGEMSLVGPRPENQADIERILESAPHYCKVLLIKPGITSWGMVKYGPANNIFQKIERARFDLMYQEDASLTADLKIIYHTIQQIITGKRTKDL